MAHPFPNIVWLESIPPEKHPGFQYEGFTPGKVVELPRGYIHRPGYGAFPLDVTLEIDVQVPMRDGMHIYTNVYRPKHSNSEKLPALIAWSPYGKNSGGRGPQNYETIGPFHLGIDYQNLSGYEKFEGPNPADWCERGYVVVDPDARGAGHSEGDIHVWDGQESEDIYDLIEWCTKQDWCDGGAVMFGNSWLAICQIGHASRCQHPALKAIAPWEALTDVYNDACARGGVPATDLLGPYLVGGFAGMARKEDAWATIRHRPLYDDYWEAKRIDVTKLTVPMYLTASYSSRIHCRGSFESFSRAPSQNKWLRVHSTQEWHDLYRKEYMDDLQKFYDHFAKGKRQNGWLETPHLRLSLLAMNGSVIKTVVERPEPDLTFPLARTRYLRYFLDAMSMNVVKSLPTQASSTSYEAHSLDDQIVFTQTFDRYTELSGISWLKVHMSCEEKNDMDVHVIIRKISLSGELLEHQNYPMPTTIEKIPNGNVPKYQGANGVLRASHHISQLPKADIDDPPAYSHRVRQNIQPGNVVALEIPIWPIGMVFGAGEGFAVIIAGHDLKLPEIAAEQIEANDENIGRHTLHTGGNCCDAVEEKILKVIWNTDPVAVDKIDIEHLGQLKPKHKASS